MQRDKKIKFQKGDYAMVDYLASENDKGYSMQYSEHVIDKNTTNKHVGRAKCPHFENGHCQVKFHRWQPWIDSLILATDYDTYSVVYAKNTGLWKWISKFESIYVLTRVPMKKDT